jgi:transcriptional regulator with XRE-family HTH domain
MSQPAIAALEAGRGNPTLDTLERWADAVETEFLVAPRISGPLAEVTAALQGADDTLAFRLALDLLDRLRELSPTELSLVTSHAPRSSGSSRHDALVAAVVELVCLERDVSVPPWCSEPVASPMWWVSALPSARRHALATCPAPFRARGIMIDESDVVRA